MNKEYATTTCAYPSASSSVCTEERSVISSDFVFQGFILLIFLIALILFYFRSLRKE